MRYLLGGIIEANYTGAEKNVICPIVTNWTTIEGHEVVIKTFQPIILIF